MYEIMGRTPSSFARNGVTTPMVNGAEPFDI